LEISGLRPSSTLASLAVAYIRKGQQSKANGLLDELLERRSNGEKGIAFFVAQVYSGLGDERLTLEWLEKAYGDHEVELIWLKVDTHFKSLHDNPSFQSLLTRVGFKK